MYPKKRNRLRVLALLLSFVLALCVLTGAALAEEPFPDTPEDPTTETAEQPPAEETPETEPGSEDALPSEPEPPEEPPMEGAYALDADVPGGWQNRPATIYVRVIDLNGTDWEKVEVILPGMSPFDVTQELLEYGCVERTMLENGTVLFFVTDRTGTVHELSLDVYCMDFSAPVLRAGINGTLLRVEAYDDLSGVAAIYVNDELYTTLDGGELNVRIDRLTDDAYLYIDALDNAGNWTDYVVLSNPFYEEAEPEPTPTPSTDTDKDQHDEHCPSDCDCRKEQASTAQPSNNTGSGGNTGNSNNTAASGSSKNAAAPSQPASSAAEPVTKEDGTGFTQNGNSVTRDLLYDKYSNKQFVTIETRGSETFYLVIDYDKPLDEDGEQYETYFLNLVDEADLLALMEEDAADAYTAEKEAAAQAELDRLKAEEEAKKAAEEAAASGEEQPKENKVTKIASGFLGVVVLIALAAGGGYLYIKMKGVKPASKKNQPDPDADYHDEDEDALQLPEDDGDEDEEVDVNEDYEAESDDEPV
mgnify:CR=1 FL=1